MWYSFSGVLGWVYWFGIWLQASGFGWFSGGLVFSLIGCVGDKAGLADFVGVLRVCGGLW